MSITGNLLTGSFLRSDIVTFAERNGDTVNIQSARYSKLSKCGYIPILSTATGSIRALLGLVHTIGHLALALFTKKKSHLEEAALGAQNFGRGLVEAVPFLGNYAMWKNDKRREANYEVMVNTTMRDSDKAAWGNEDGGHFAMFHSGILVADSSFKNFKAHLDIKLYPTLGTIESVLIRKRGILPNDTYLPSGSIKFFHPRRPD